MATQQAQGSTSAPGGTQGYQAITIRPMTGVLGAEIEGVDLSKPSETITAEIRQALAEYLVLVFRDQELTHDEYKDFARSLGGPLEQTDTKNTGERISSVILTNPWMRFRISTRYSTHWKYRRQAAILSLQTCTQPTMLFPSP